MAVEEIQCQTAKTGPGKSVLEKYKYFKCWHATKAARVQEVFGQCLGT